MQTSYTLSLTLAVEDEDLGHTDKVQHEIHLSDDKNNHNTE